MIPSKALLRPALSPRTIRPQQIQRMHIQSLPMWVGSSNNYAYLVTDATTKTSVIIDPANPSEVAPTIHSALSSGRTSHLSAILNTHHHWDHAGGNGEMLKQFGPTTRRVVGGGDCEAVTETPAHGDRFRIGDGIEVTALHTPCHTQDSICYYMEDRSLAADTVDNKEEGGEEGGGIHRAVFTGDTLFVGGCGRFFEGTPAQMHHALNTVLASLPDDTRVFPGHEYTKANVRFLESVTGDGDGDDEAVQALKRFADDNVQTQGRFTVADEKRHNVFMRVGEEGMRKVTGKEEPSEVLGRLREMKNNM